MHVVVTEKYIELRGFWTSRIIRIDMETIVAVRKSKYKRNILRRASYNLHSTGFIRFYTSGEAFVEIKDKSGYVYRIGSQRVDQLLQILESQVKK